MSYPVWSTVYLSKAYQSLRQINGRCSTLFSYMNTALGLRKITIEMKANNTIRKCCFVVAMILLLTPNLRAQENTYDFLGLQITYPSNCSIFGSYIESSDEGDQTCCFFVSMVDSDGKEERMKVCVEESASLTTVYKLEDFEDVPTILVTMLDASPRYLKVEQETSGKGKNYVYADYTAKLYTYLRRTPEDNMYYLSIRGRVVVKVLGNYLIYFTMEGPETTNFSVMQKIVNSLKHKPLFG